MATLITDVFWDGSGCYCCEWYDPSNGFVSRFYGTREQCENEAKRRAPSDPFWVKDDKRHHGEPKK